ncbi:MAG: type II toxin-antitoxin system VapC family toxin [Deltaproteobacteria bacterium]|nr:type II toxin-antitoxin system VapC family toxin [Deltaproteobacteria bacterium]
MHLIDTNVISEMRKGPRANGGVRGFFASAVSEWVPAYVSVVTIGELRRVAERIRHRGDVAQAGILDVWLAQVLVDDRECILEFGEEAAQVWGRLRVPHPEHELDKQIAATALVHDLTVVTREERDFARTGVRVLNPFTDVP